MNNQTFSLRFILAIKKKQHQQQQQPPKLQSSISLFLPDSNKTNKRTIEESRNISNSNFITTNYDLTNKRQKRIGIVIYFRLSYLSFRSGMRFCEIRSKRSVEA
jgi:hypothetical protein